MSLREIDYLCPNLPLFFIFFFLRGLGETMLAEASVLDTIAGKRVIGISSLAISVSSSGLMLLSEKIIFNKHWVHPVLYGPDLQFLPFSGHGHFGASAILSWVLVFSRKIWGEKSIAGYFLLSISKVAAGKKAGWRCDAQHEA